MPRNLYKQSGFSGGFDQPAPRWRREAVSNGFLLRRPGLSEAFDHPCLLMRYLGVIRLEKKSVDRPVMSNLRSALTSTTTMKRSLHTWQHCRRTFGLAGIVVLCLDAHIAYSSYIPEINNDREVGR